MNSSEAFRVFLFIPAAIFLSACGAGNPGTVDIKDVSGSNSSIVIAHALLNPGSECAFGGAEIKTGIDKNGNGILDASEVGQTKVICNGDAGYNSLVRVYNEPAGANCQTGGKQFITGLDTNRNGELDANEIEDTQYVCNGAEGPAGMDGMSCGVMDNGDGTKTISCSDGTSVTVSDGQDGKDGGSCSVADNSDGTKTISCEDGTSAIVADGANNQANSSISCIGSLEDWTSLNWKYRVHQLNSGDVIATAVIGGSFFESSRTNYYSYFQVGSIAATVLIGMDVLGTSNYGFWEFSLDRVTLITTIKYYDVDLVDYPNPKTWVMPANKCILNYYG